MKKNSLDRQNKIRAWKGKKG